MWRKIHIKGCEMNSNYIGLDVKNKILTLSAPELTPFGEGTLVRQIEIKKEVDMFDLKKKVNDFGQKHNLEILIVNE